MYSMQPEAKRKRAYRERLKQLKQRHGAAATVPGNVPVPVPGNVPVPDNRPLSVPPPATSSASSSHPPPSSVPSPAGPDASRDTSPRDVPRSSSAALRETEVVRGPGAEAFARPTVLGADDEGQGGTTLVDAPPPPPPPATSPEEAALIAKAVGVYVGFGWGLLAKQHEDKIGPLAETVAATIARARPELAPQLAKLSPREKFSMGLGALVGIVEGSAARLALKYNVRIPYQDELIVGTGIGTATLGIVQEFREPKQQFREPSNDARENVRDTTATETPERPRPRDTFRDVPPPRAQEPVNFDDLEAPAVQLRLDDEDSNENSNGGSA